MNRSKRTSKKNRYFGTCKPANCDFIYQSAGFVQETVSCNLQQHKDVKSMEKST